MGKSGLIHDVVIVPLRQIPDERGKVMHMLRNDSPYYGGFGEVYFSVVNPGRVKAWKRHREMTQRLAVPVGQVRFVIYDDREGSSTRGVIQEILTGEEQYTLVIIPKLLWYGFQGIAPAPSLIANCADMPHDPDESERKDADESAIPFDWQGCR